MEIKIQTPTFTAIAKWTQDSLGWQWQVQVYEYGRYITTLESEDMNWIMDQLTALELRAS